jgi:hypothetical protein
MERPLRGFNQTCTALRPEQPACMGGCSVPLRTWAFPIKSQPCHCSLDWCRNGLIAEHARTYLNVVEMTEKLRVYWLVIVNTLSRFGMNPCVEPGSQWSAFID